MKKRKLTGGIVDRAYRQACRAYVGYTTNPTPATRWKYVTKWAEYAKLRCAVSKRYGWQLNCDFISNPFFHRADWLAVINEKA